MQSGSFRIPATIVSGSRAHDGQPTSPLTHNLGPDLLDRYNDDRVPFCRSERANGKTFETWVGEMAGPDSTSWIQTPGQSFHPSQGMTTTLTIVYYMIMTCSRHESKNNSPPPQSYHHSLKRDPAVPLSLVFAARHPTDQHPPPLTPQPVDEPEHGDGEQDESEHGVRRRAGR